MHRGTRSRKTELFFFYFCYRSYIVIGSLLNCTVRIVSHWRREQIQRSRNFILPTAMAVKYNVNTSCKTDLYFPTWRLFSFSKTYSLFHRNSICFYTGPRVERTGRATGHLLWFGRFRAKVESIEPRHRRGQTAMSSYREKMRLTRFIKRARNKRFVWPGRTLTTISERVRPFKTDALPPSPRPR